MILPQLVAGGGWSSQIVLSNSTAAAMLVRVDLFLQDGTPLTTSFNGQSASSFQNIVIPPQGVVVESSNDPGALQVGYVIVTPINTPPPAVTLTAPANGNSRVAINTEVTAAFSEPMDPSTISTMTFILMQGTTPISGAVTYAGLTAAFIPAVALVPNTVYTSTITTGAESLFVDLPLASNFVWRFTTGAAPDTTPPTVSFTNPSNAAIAAPINQTLSATFSEPLDPATINMATFILKTGATSISGAVNYIGLNAIFTPAGNLAPGTVYTATITNGVRDVAENALASNYVWMFTTAATVSVTTPVVTSANPANAAAGIALNQQITVTFSEPMNPTTITNANFTLMQGLTQITGTVAYAGLTATFSPLSLLTAGTVYTVTLTNGARDLAGNALTGGYLGTFTTAVPQTVTSNGAPTQINAAGSPTPLIEEFSTVWDIGNPLLGLMFYVQPSSSLHRVSRTVTTDGGLTWTAGVDIGLTQVTPASAEERNPVVRDFAANGSLTGFFGTKQGTYPSGFGPNDVLFSGLSSDTGVSWTGESQLTFNMGAFAGNSGMNGMIEVFKTSTGILRGYTAMNNFGGTPSSTTHRVESQDGGATWMDMGTIQIPGPGGVFNIAGANGSVFHFTDTADNLVKMGWFCFGEGPEPPNRGVQFLTSTDEGLSWTAGSLGFIDTTIESGDANFLSDSTVRLFYYRNTTAAPNSLWYEDFAITGMQNIQPNNLFLAP